MSRSLIIAALMLFPTVAQAAEEDLVTKVSAVAAGELHVAPELTGNGIVLLQVDFDERYRIRVNTDTLDLSGSFEVDESTTIRLGLAGEAFLAGVFTNYFQAGELIRGRAFSATWGGGYAELDRSLGHDLYLQWRPQVRVWRFGRGAAGERLVLPADFTSVESKLGLTYWNFAPDRSLWEPHRFFQRLVGVGAGVETESWWRSSARRWGHPTDPRNDDERLNVSVAQWASIGAGTDGARAQISQRLRIGFDEDDVNRARIGGFNPYTVPLAGVGWPAYLSSRYASARGSLHFAVAGESELGLAVDGVVLRDPLRDGNPGYGALGAVSAFVDVRIDQWQFDAHFGWTLPSPLLARDPQLGGFVALGRSM